MYSNKSGQQSSIIYNRVNQGEKLNNQIQTREFFDNEEAKDWMLKRKNFTTKSKSPTHFFNAKAKKNIGIDTNDNGFTSIYKYEFSTKNTKG